ncbi:3'(2'),5'-bisphosphate nucleotidase CysQ [Rhodovulum sulfidophilum]|uniref:3'(2'),5'-bisphosphate nucleotidase CysQ n=1 Tax=Rhodovulum sulfidophilum TaxID=35806 RepID=UPI0009516E6B|nr:3'(2'),5'-bisphosphate nucleotidase CysQ [Rhodovulum sulfidophilum]MBL3553804.1 3'(2'),5'-bisphosphate nucleotidase CysQ [Rhodovulum sulfidophilum]OLS50174.1 3'(2'),5'-bisphosphate nucleotidase CysQ [Rhodovulum sulfidophilum]
MPARDLALLTTAALEAGKLARRYWCRDPQTWEKPDHQGPVSEADLAIDRMLRQMLTAARPGYGWLSEETEDDPARLGAERVFIVDPIDGTRTFLEGDRSFAHALAVAKAGRVVAAVVFLPLRDKLYSAIRGGGAYLNGAALRTGSRSALDGASVLAPRPTLDPGHWTGPVPHLHRALRASLAYRLCLVAEGRYDAALALRDSWDWDTAAGSLILEEAGARISDRLGDPLAFNTPVPLSRGIVAGAPLLHAEILSRLA